MQQAPAHNPGDGGRAGIHARRRAAGDCLRHDRSRHRNGVAVNVVEEFCGAAGQTVLCMHDQCTRPWLCRRYWQSVGPYMASLWTWWLPQPLVQHGCCVPLRAYRWSHVPEPRRIKCHLNDAHMRGQQCARGGVLWPGGTAGRGTGTGRGHVNKQYANVEKRAMIVVLWQC
jgi:hypothetical protein